MKLRKLHIENYKMFKDFDIDFVDKDDNPLPIIILAGVNGSGKTTLLEYIDNSNLEDKSFINIEINRKTEPLDDFIKDDIREYIKENIVLSKLNNLNEYKQNIVYFQVAKDKIEDIKETIRQKYIDRAFEIDKPSEALKELQNYIKNIFNGLDLTFNLSSINYNKEEVLFKDNNGVEFDIDKLSTGEKTLLSKVLYLYFKDYKDKVILIDEPELSLHPSWQNKVLKIYENFALQNSCQIIIATHSAHIIGSAKNEYIRFLEKNRDGTIIAISDIQAYGRDIEWVLGQMGVENIRLPKITEKFNEIQKLINSGEFDKADTLLDKLEFVIGENDKDILALRNDLAFERIDFEEDN